MAWLLGKSLPAINTGAHEHAVRWWKLDWCNSTWRQIIKRLGLSVHTLRADSNSLEVHVSPYNRILWVHGYHCLSHVLEFSPAVTPDEGLLGGLDRLHIVGWIETHLAILAACAPTLLVFIIEFLKHFPCGLKCCKVLKTQGIQWELWVNRFNNINVTWNMKDYRALVSQ